MRKTKDVLKKIGGIKGIFHARMGMIKDRNGKDLTEAEQVARIHGRTTQTGLNDLNNHKGWSLSQSDIFWSVKSTGP